MDCSDTTAAPSPTATTPATLSRRSLIASGAALGAVGLGLLSEHALAKSSAESDVVILNYALGLEYLQAAFYAEAAAAKSLPNPYLRFATIVADHEQQHVDYLRVALGSKAKSAPKFEFGDATSDPDKFASTATTLEDIAVSAYNGAAVMLTRGALRAAARVVSVDARHAAWIRTLRGQNPAKAATDPGLSQSIVAAQVARLGFVR